MNIKVENFITRKYYELLTISKRITKGNDLSQDLLHEVIIQLFDKEKIVLNNYEDNTIKYYITAIMRINWYSKTSPFYYRVRRERCMYNDLTDIVDMPEEQEVFETQLIFDILEQEFSELNWFHKSLFEMYLTLGSLKRVSKKTNIPLTSISRYIKEAKEQTKTNIIKKLNA